jgi:hypothetical protein
MLASTRPVQAIMGLCGLVAAAGMITAQYLQTWTPMDDFVRMVGYNTVLTMFIVYAVLSWISAVLNFCKPPYETLKYTATYMGILLWTICLGSSLAWHQGSLVLRDGMSFLYTIPLSADVWVLVQMIARVDNIERRLWK